MREINAVIRSTGAGEIYHNLLNLRLIKRDEIA
jgi:hypothetical protein